MKNNYEFHPLCLLLPEPSATEYADLKTDILKNGLLDPVIRHEKKVLDGRCRYLCCLELGIEPTFVDFADLGFKGSPTAYVISKNINRRHLTTEQRGIAAGKLTTLESGALSKEEAAKLLNVSERTVTRARNVVKDAIPEVQQEVEQGMLNITQAERIAKKPAEEQPTALAEEKAKAEASQKKANETKKARAATQTATTQSEKALATYTDCDALCKEGQYDGKKLRKAIAQLKAAVDDLAFIDTVIAEMLEAGHAFHNLSVSISILEKHTGIAVESLKKNQLAKQNQYDASHKRLVVMKKFIDEFPALAESLFNVCSTTDEQDLLLDIQNTFAEHKTSFDESVNHATNTVKLQVLTVTEASPPNDWFSDSQTTAE